LVGISIALDVRGKPQQLFVVGVQPLKMSLDCSGNFFRVFYRKKMSDDFLIFVALRFRAFPALDFGFGRNDRLVHLR
jgi:hypothetical protein